MYCPELDFDDVLLLPSLSDIISRELVDLSINLSGKLKLNIPIIASPMRGIISTDIIKGLSLLGGIGILHRFYDNMDKLETDVKIIREYKYGLAVGLGELDKVYLAIDNNVDIICIDVANGYLKSVRDFSSTVKNIIIERNSSVLLMSGNVVTSEGINSLVDSGVDLVRVGIGSGQLCTTRYIAGVGRPQLSAIADCHTEKGYIVADGGIRTSGDAVKAFVFGADLVMIGSLFAQTYESANDGIIYGMASRKLQEEYYHGVKSVEGISREERKSKSLQEFITEFIYGIKSACTYLNASNLSELKKSDKFISLFRKN